MKKSLLATISILFLIILAVLVYSFLNKGERSEMTESALPDNIGGLDEFGSNHFFNEMFGNDNEDETGFIDVSEIKNVELDNLIAEGWQIETIFKNRVAINPNIGQVTFLLYRDFNGIAQSNIYVYEITNDNLIKIVSFKDADGYLWTPIRFIDEKKALLSSRHITGNMTIPKGIIVLEKSGQYDFYSFDAIVKAVNICGPSSIDVIEEDCTLGVKLNNGSYIDFSYEAIPYLEPTIFFDPAGFWSIPRLIKHDKTANRLYFTTHNSSLSGNAYQHTMLYEVDLRSGERHNLGIVDTTLEISFTEDGGYVYWFEGQRLYPGGRTWISGVNLQTRESFIIDPPPNLFDYKTQNSFSEEDSISKYIDLVEWQDNFVTVNSEFSDFEKNILLNQTWQYNLQTGEYTLISEEE